MDTLPERVARALLLAVGLLSLMTLWETTPAVYLDLIGIAALLSAGALLLRAERQQTRWDRPMPRPLDV